MTNNKSNSPTISETAAFIDSELQRLSFLVSRRVERMSNAEKEEFHQRMENFMKGI